ncbi:hypothetical protein SteCoe_29347 [Stentor coeruleus]|uniref:Uncharacterized protein n=1 Tax=Stentor coeruleus TaxID=5963 RepID=A0A1R2B680_9CILI|nr:hypothetical protein SteCoe_29347 [Stentor coeruleus]
MDINCKFTNCTERANWECTCQGNPKFCKFHIELHQSKAHCYFKPFDPLVIIIAKIKTMQNALTLLESESIGLANFMTIEISSNLRNIISHSKEKKNQIKLLILNNQNEEAQSIVTWANNLIFAYKNHDEFKLYLKNFLHIDKGFSTQTETFKNEIEKPEFIKKSNLKSYSQSYKTLHDSENMKYFEAYSRISTLEEELCKIKFLCQEKENIIQNYEAEKLLTIKQNDETYARIKELTNSINCLDKSQKNIQEMQIEIEKYESDKQKLLEKTNNRIKELENCLDKSQKNIQEMQIEIEKYESDKQKLEKYLKKANENISRLENELDKFENVSQEKQEEIIKTENKVLTMQELLELSYVKIKKLEEELECQNIFNKKNNEHKNYENYMIDEEKYLYQDNKRIEILEKNLVIKGKIIEEFEEKIRELEDKLKDSEESLEKANVNTKVLGDELKNLQQKLNSFQINEREDIEKDIKMQYIKKFRSMNETQKVDFLVQENYINFEKDLVKKNRYIHEINISSDVKYIFICKNKADCIRY